MPRRILQDLAAGKSLAEGMAAPMPLAPFLDLAIHITRALSALHGQGAFHGNLCPQAIVVHPTTGEVSLVDARAGVGEEALAYVSPEQTGRMNRRVDERCDLYSLGVVFYELLAGGLPLRAGDALGWVHAHVALAPEPLSERAPEVPAAVSAIVMRLLAKAAEDRYQTAAGLARDLERCREALQRHGGIEPFPLGEEDRSDRLSVPQKLHGRSAELGLLLGAFERVVATGKPELVTVSGYAGIGKSALVLELHRPLLRARGLFISGKFEQYSRGKPYATLVLAFRELTQQILTESEEQLAAFRSRLQAALGGSGRLITDVLPDIRLIVGEQPPVAELGPTEAQNRFQRVFQAFIRAVGRPEHPVALFLDDLQWADTATLDLLALLATDPELRHVVFILAFRDNEVDAAHPLRAALDKIQRAGAALSAIHLAPLDLESTAALVADTLRCPPDRALPLARVVFQKTAGNPFFAGEFMKALHQEGLLAHDPEARSFCWDLGRIEARSITDNVVDLVLDRIERLPAATLAALPIAACVGTTFRLGLLAGVSGKAPAEVAADLLPALREELIAPLGGASPWKDDARDPVYRFEHDRIQQAAYALLDAEQRRAVHVAIGRALLAETPPDGVGDAVFEIVNQLDVGLPLITDPDERQRLAALNALAGRKAKASMAYAPALRYLRTARELLPEDAWSSAYEETLALHLDLAECAYLRGDLEDGEALLDLALARARDLLDEGRIYVLRLLCYEKLARFPEGLATGVRALGRFGVEVPPDAEGAIAAFGVELGRVKESLGDRRVADLIEGELMPEGIPKMTMTLLAHVNGFAYMMRPELFPLFCAKSVVIALNHGSGLYCAKAYGPFSVIQCIVFGDVDTAYEYSRLALALCDRFDDVRTRASVLYSHGAMVSLWKEHYDVAVEYTERSFDHALEHGDYGNGNYAAMDLPWLRFARGDRLEDVVAETARYEGLARISGQAWNERVIQTTRQALESLRGRTSPRGALAGEGFDDAAMAEAARASGNVQETAYTGLARMIHAFLFGRFEEADAWGEGVRGSLACMKGRVTEALYTFYRGLTLAARNATGAPAEEQRGREELAGCLATLERWAATAPVNFGHQHALLSAELARIDGRVREAMALYEQAARGAREGRFPQDEALARELAARLYLDLDQPLGARALLGEARALYLGWGAAGKGALLGLDDASPAAAAGARAAGGPALDLVAVLQASQAISGEIDRDRLLHRLMTLTLQAAAAERGCLLRVQDEQLVPLAEAGVRGGEVTTEVRAPGGAGEPPAVPLSILHYVRRTRASVVLDDASRDARFAGDPRITASGPRSLLCLPLLRQAELTGILYLENNLTTCAFTADRIAVLELLASQAAISLENATLYTELRDKLEVIQRQLDVIQEQREAIRVLATPIIEVWDGVLMAPVLGALDGERAASMMDLLLSAVVRTQSRHVILDLTAVEAIDATTAEHVLRLVGAVSLLGARGLVVGIQPRVAVTLVGSGFDPSRATVLANLREALLFCMQDAPAPHNARRNGAGSH